MKKLNNKGFTLVELLAVIIILAVVVGISIPAVMSTVNDSKNKAMGVATDAAQTWLEEQVTLYNTNPTLADDNFDATLANVSSTTTKTYKMNADKIKIEAMGFPSKNINEVTVTSTNGRICVTITEILTSSDYYTTKYWDAPTEGNVATNPHTDAANKSSHC